MTDKHRQHQTSILTSDRAVFTHWYERKKKRNQLHEPNQKEAKDRLIAEPAQFRDFYPVIPPFGNVGIELNKDTGSLFYRVIEPTMSANELELLSKLKNMIKEETTLSLSILRDEKLLEASLLSIVQKMIKRFKLNIDKGSIDKFTYFVKRDFLGYGIIDVLIHDQNIEDISCNGTSIPIYVWHRTYESLPTNILFKSREELDTFITRLAYRSGHQVSISSPILEGALPEGFRIHVTLEEVSKRGGTFTIRKARANPYTITDLISLGTIPPVIAAYFWLMVENRKSLIASGATAAGKTALLNAICSFIPSELKVVTIEEVRELRLHDNWIPMVTRPSTQDGITEVTLFDLLKSSLRQRPDYIIVGEVRGEEAYTLFQSISVGHGGMCTIHAENVDAVEKRLLTKPMDIPPLLIPLMNVICQLNRTKYGGKVVRRITELSEINSKGDIKPLYKWDPRDDSFALQIPDLSKSLVLNAIAETKHISIEAVIEDLMHRELILNWMVNNKLNIHEQVSDLIRRFYVNPSDIYNQARFDV